MKTIFRVECKRDFKYLVVAHNADEAYLKVRNYLDEKDLGFSSERGLKSIEVIGNKIDDDDYDDIYEELY